MANPYKDADKAQKKTPGSKQKAVEEKVEPKREEIAVEKKAQEEALKSDSGKVVKNKPAKPVAKSEPKEKTDIFAKLNSEKPTGKTYAYYLSEENAEKLKKMAEKKGVSTSKLLDHILSELL